MRDNWNLEICGGKVTLVPYTRDRVDTYHGWMQDPFLLEMTGSEPMTLEEEYDMQQSWKEDSDKCTFIITTLDASSQASVMVGDMNLFLSREDVAESGEEGPLVAEINVMVAEERFRQQGLAKEAILLTMHYGVQRLGVDKYMCKIQETNSASRNLFIGLGFAEVNYVAAFKEYEYALDLRSKCRPPEQQQQYIMELLQKLCDISEVVWSEKENESSLKAEETIFLPGTRM